MPAATWVAMYIRTTSLMSVLQKGYTRGKKGLVLTTRMVRLLMLVIMVRIGENGENGENSVDGEDG